MRREEKKFKEKIETLKGTEEGIQEEIKKTTEKIRRMR